MRESNGSSRSRTSMGRRKIRVHAIKGAISYEEYILHRELTRAPAQRVLPRSSGWEPFCEVTRARSLSFPFVSPFIRIRIDRSIHVSSPPQQTDRRTHGRTDGRSLARPTCQSLSGWAGQGTEGRQGEDGWSGGNPFLDNKDGGFARSAMWVGSMMTPPDLSIAFHSVM